MAPNNRMVYIVDKIIDDTQKIIEWLTNKHWWPFRNTEHEKLTVRELFSTDKITAILIEDSVRKVVVPIAVSHEKPVTIDYLKINGRYIFEAEYLRNYWEELRKINFRLPKSLNLTFPVILSVRVSLEKF